MDCRMSMSLTIESICEMNDHEAWVLVYELNGSETIAEWESTFVDKCTGILEAGNGLSEKQKTKIREIYDQDLTRK